MNETEKQTDTAGEAGLEIAPGADMVRIAPGALGWMPRGAARQSVPRHCLCRWTMQSGGAFVPIPFPYRYVRLTAEVARLLGFGIPGRRAKSRLDTLRRLSNAGFISMVKVAPGTYLLDLDSWFAHIAACMDDEDFWAPECEAARRYRQANFTPRVYRG